MKELSIFLISLFMIIACIGCALYTPYTRVMVTVPEIPLNWKQRFNEVSFCIEYLDVSGSKKTEILPSGVTRCVLQLPKIRNWPIIALPYGDSYPLPPAGALYSWNPGKNNTMTLSLSWEQGFSASLLQDCCEKGCDVSRFNAPRFMQEVWERSGGDPWKLDYSFIAEKIVNNDFRANYIRMLPHKDVDLLTGKGKWFFLSPFSPVYEIEQEEVFCFKNIPFGFHRLFNGDCSERYEMYITHQETIIVYYEDVGE